jgi:hypothetical protein
LGATIGAQRVKRCSCKMRVYSCWSLAQAAGPWGALQMPRSVKSLPDSATGQSRGRAAPNGNQLCTKSDAKQGNVDKMASERLQDIGAALNCGDEGSKPFPGRSRIRARLAARATAAR